jgi:hypothetical protein
MKGRSASDVHTDLIAKVDVLNQKNDALSGVYALIPVDEAVCKDGRVNEDFLKDFIALQHSQPYCKETTL